MRHPKFLIAAVLLAIVGILAITIALLCTRPNRSSTDETESDLSTNGTQSNHSTSEDRGFRAAVFEHAQQSFAMTSQAPKDIVLENLDYYARATILAKTQGVDIIVFPEYGIFPSNERTRLKSFLENIPDPKTASVNPCQEPEVYSDRLILHTLSCLAQNNKMIIVANMGDIQPCKGQGGCPKDGVFHFNTNVVFDREGKLLLKYHKEHLFGEPGMDLPAEQQDPTFETDLGRFATFICFDIVFQRITEVARWEGVRAILFPTKWVDSLPMINSIQYYQAWSIGNNMTLLAANVHLPGASAIGSGIMKGRQGAHVYTLNPDGNSKLLISDFNDSRTDAHSIYIVSKNGTEEYKEDGKDLGHECSRKILQSVEDMYKDYRCLERDTDNFNLTKLSKTRDTITACNKGLCCKLEYSANEMKENFYLGVYNGSISAFGRYHFEEETCVLARCDGLGKKACVTFPMRSETVFYEVRMEAHFSTEFIYPSFVESGMRLTPVNQWKYESRDKTASILFKNSSGKKLLVVGFKGRPYERDPPYVRGQLP